MPTQITRTLSRTATVERSPIRYPVVWAHTEADVTPFDPVRGGSPTSPFTMFEEQMKGRALQPHHLLGGGLPAPSRFEVKGAAYPRLTRRTPFVPTKELPAIGAKDKVCQALSALAGFENDEQKFMKQVLAIANKHGPLWPDSSMSLEWDTLRAWKESASLMKLYLCLVRLIKEVGERLEGTSDGEREAHELEQRQKLFEAAQRERLNLFHFTAHPFRETPISDLPLKEFKEELAAYFWGRFALAADIRIGDRPGRVFVTCGSLIWAYKELWDLLNSSLRVLLCQRCGNAFVAARSDAQTCGAACEKALQRQRKT